MRRHLAIITITVLALTAIAGKNEPTQKVISLEDQRKAEYIQDAVGGVGEGIDPSALICNSQESELREEAQRMLRCKLAECSVGKAGISAEIISRLYI